MSDTPAFPAARITALEEHPRRKGRVLVSVDGEAIGALSVDLVTDLGVREGGVVTAALRNDLAVAARRTAMLDRALDLLAVRSRSASELRRRLVRPRPTARGAGRGAGRDATAGTAAPPADPQDIDWVIQRLSAQGYLDDAQFARQFARARMVGGGVSRRRLQDELYRRGVGREVAAEAIDHTLDDAQLDEYTAARDAARKRLRALASLDHAVLRRRLYGFLARRGYEPDVVSRVLREVLASDPEALSGDDS